MEKAASAIELISKQDECDEWETFGNGVANDLRQLPAKNRRHAKFAIQKLLFEFHEGTFFLFKFVFIYFIKIFHYILRYVCCSYEAKRTQFTKSSTYSYIKICNS